MDKIYLKDEMQALGWSYYETGGGCDAWFMGSEDGNHALLTAYNDANVPTDKNQKVSVGFYTVGEDKELVGNTLISEIACTLDDILTGKVEVSVDNDCYYCGTHIDRQEQEDNNWDPEEHDGTCSIECEQTQNLAMKSRGY